MIRIRYRDSNELSPGLHAAADRHGRTTTLYLLSGLTVPERQSALRRLRLSARMGHCPPGDPGDPGPGSDRRRLTQPGPGGGSSLPSLAGAGGGQGSGGQGSGRQGSGRQGSGAGGTPAPAATRTQGTAARSPEPAPSTTPGSGGICVHVGSLGVCLII